MLALLIAGGASLLFSCKTKQTTTVYDYETLMTESSENRTITMMENGKRSYSFASPLMEGYSLASNPYQEFRRGIKMTTYTDSLSLEDATITANYAIYYERQRLWEAKGNVVIIKKNREEGDTAVKGLTEIYTQQLFWNATTKKIYSNVDTKVLQPDGWHFGVGFDADDDLKNIHFRKYSSEIEFDMSQPDPAEVEAEESEAKGAAQSEAKGAAQNEAKSGAKAPSTKAAKSNAGDRGGDRSVRRPAQPSNAGRSGGISDHNPSPITRPEREVGDDKPAKNLSATPKIPSMGGKSAVNTSELDIKDASTAQPAMMAAPKGNANMLNGEGHSCDNSDKR